MKSPEFVTRYPGTSSDYVKVQAYAGNDNYAALTMEEILADHIKPLGVPAWQGAMIGHDQPQWTLPFGLEVEIDADLLELAYEEARARVESERLTPAERTYVTGVWQRQFGLITVG